MHRIVQRGLVQIPEGRQLFPSLTVEENLSSAASPRGVEGARRAAPEMERAYALFPGWPNDGARPRHAQGASSRMLPSAAR